MRNQSLHSNAPSSKMTIIVSILVPSGIVLAADSRQVIETVPGQLRVDSDNAEKIVQLGPRMAAMVNGLGTIYSDRNKSPRAVGDILRILAAHIPKNGTVRDTGDSLHKKVISIVNKHHSVIKQKSSGISFFVAGYCPTKDIGEVYRCDVPGKIVLERKTDDAGAVWNGERSVIDRLILGHDPRLLESILPLIGNEQAKTLRLILRKMQPHINFQTMPLQDAIDLAALLVGTTIEFLRFSDGLVGSPGQFPSCGGNICIAAITRAEGFRWLRRKEPGVTLR